MRQSVNAACPTAETVFHGYAPQIYRIARRMLGNDADAEDVTQDVLVQVVRKLDTFRGDAQLSTWLYRVTINAALAHRQKRAVREGRQLGESLDTLVADGEHRQLLAGREARPDARLADAETRQLIERAINGLPVAYRDVYVLADVEELANAEIGDRLGLTVAAVKSRLHRARMLMRGSLVGQLGWAAA